jgi:hypothetical protein
MAWDDLVRVKLENGAVTSVGRSFAEQHAEDGALEILLDEDGNELPATSNGLTIEPEYPPMTAEAIADLKGADLTDALKSAGLPLNGTADEKRQRLADHNSAGDVGASV